MATRRPRRETPGPWTFRRKACGFEFCKVPAHSVHGLLRRGTHCCFCVTGSSAGPYLTSPFTRRLAPIRRAATGAQPRGPEAIREQKPGTRPEKLKKSPAPLFHAFLKTARRSLYEGFALFVAAFREASEKLRKGDEGARFPAGSFPPGRPFVTA